MTRFWINGMLGAAAMLLSLSMAHAEHTRVTYPSVLGVEVLGRGLVYSVFFDRALDDQLVAGIGFGHVKLTSPSKTDTVTVIPVYANYYFAREAGSLFASGGVTVATADVDNLKSNTSGVEFGSAPIVPTVGLGYENRSDAKFLFRMAAYALVAENVRPWVGFSLGYAF